MFLGQLRLHRRTLDQTLADGWGALPLDCLLFVTLLTLEQLLTVVTTDPQHFSIAGRKVATLAHIWAQVVLIIGVGFLAAVAKVTVGKKPRHFSDDVIMVVTHVEVHLLAFLWTGVDDVICILF